MRFKFAFFAALLIGSILLGGCTAGAQGDASQSGNSGTQPQVVYRGSVEEMLEDGSFRVAQVDGYDYGQPSIIFHMGEGVAVTGDLEISEGAYVQVTYSGILARSMPPQGTADEVAIIASHSDGIVVNGTIKAVEEVDENYRIDLLPFTAAEDTRENQVILMVPKDALENLSAEQLEEGMEVCAVTKGIAATSLPPQMPVVVLLPYLPAVN